MYSKDYDIENNQESVKRQKYDDTLYVVSQFLQQFHSKQNPILDLGSGDCHYHTYFEEYKFVGLDIGKTHKGKATDKIINQNIEEFPYNIPNEDCPFEFIISLDALDHLNRPDRVLDYLLKDDHILKKGGYVFVSVPNINTLDDKLLGINTAVYDPRIKRATSGRWNATHLRFFDIDALIQMCEGYEIKAITGSNFHTSELLRQMASNLWEIGVDGLTYCNMLRNTNFVLYAPNICILLQK